MRITHISTAVIRDFAAILTGEDPTSIDRVQGRHSCGPDYCQSYERGPGYAGSISKTDAVPRCGGSVRDHQELLDRVEELVPRCLEEPAKLDDFQWCRPLCNILRGNRGHRSIALERKVFKSRYA